MKADRSYAALPLAIANEIQPRTELTVSQWADRFRIVPPGTSPEPGPWRTDRVPYLREILDAASDPAVERIYIQAASQVGKALALDTPIPTPSGWTMMGDLRVGDLVFDEQGIARSVLATSEIMHGRPCYRMRFSDGEEILADAGHRWYVEAPFEHGRGHHTGKWAGVLTTEQIAATAHWRAGVKRVVRNHYAIPVARPLMTGAADLPVPPYVLGAWLGDGHSYSAQITVGRDDEELLEHLRAAGVDAFVASNVVGAMTVKLRCREGESLSRRLNALGLLKGPNPSNDGNEKAIPGVYLRADAAQRMELLRGLMDTDGHVTKRGICEFVTTSPLLRDGMVELLVSLGLKPTVREKQPSCVHRGVRRHGRTAWRIGFVAYADASVFHLSRKRARLFARTGRRTTETERRRIVAVERVPSVPVRCIAVDGPSHLFLAGRRMVPTHNSEILLSVIGYYADQEPAPILLVQATEIAMRGFSKERVAPMFDASPALRGKLAEGARDPSNTVMLRQFPGGLLACAWAGSAASLASRPIRIVLGDELDRWPDTTGRDGDPWAQAVQRASNFHNRKVLAVSTPTVDGVSAIARLYDDSDQRRYHVPCPHCGAYQVLEWSGVIYKNAAGDVDLDQVHYKCAHCGERIDERDKPQMLAAGEWKAEREHRYRGYQISALYSPWVRWRELVQEWVKANVERDKRGLQEFVNLRLGETWTEESERITVEALEKNREPYDGVELPDGVLLLTAGVDVQDNRLEAEVVGWGVGKESWGVAYEIIAGDTATPDPWSRLDAFLARTRSKADGRALALWCACVDSGGHRTDEVYTFCRDRHARNVFAIKGYAGAGRPVVDKPTLNKLRAPLYPVGADTGKDLLYSRLALAEPGPGYCHFPLERGRGYDDEYFKGLVSEKRVTKIRGGRRFTVWTPTRARNEPLDVRVYATAAMELLTPDFAALAAAEEKTRGPGGGGGAAPASSGPAAKPQRRRVLSRGVGW